MQHKLYSGCIDPNLLNVNQHIDSAHLASDCFAPSDDVEIATGQASFDDDDGDIYPKTSTWIGPHHSRGIDEDLDDGSAGYDYQYVHRLHLFSDTLKPFADPSTQLSPSSQRTSKRTRHRRV